MVQDIKLVLICLIKAQGHCQMFMVSLELTPEAKAKLCTLVECLNFDNESAVVNELFYQFILGLEPDKRRMIMAAYQMNVKSASSAGSIAK